MFTDKVLKTALYEDAENIIFLRETSYDPYGRVTKIRAGYCDTMNNLNTRLPVITEYIYTDATPSITEHFYRDRTAYTKKRTVNDWNGKVKKVMEWIDVNPENTGQTYLDPEPGDPGVVITEYAYDGTGDCVFMKNGEGEIYYHDYNTLGQLEKTTCYRGEADAETAEYSYYDENGNLICFVDREGNKTNYTHDSINRLIDEYTRDAEKGSITTRTTTGYGLFGPVRVVKKDENNVIMVDYRYEYNSLGQVTAFRQSVRNGTGYKHYSVTTTYDLGGNPDVIQLWEGEPGSVLIKALDYDPVTWDIEDAVSGAVYEYMPSGRGDRIVKTTGHLWGGIDTV